MQSKLFTITATCLSILGGITGTSAFPMADGTVAARESDGMLSSRATLACGDPRLAKPFFRAWNPSIGDHFYTTGEAEYNNAAAVYGYTKEGIAGYIFPSQQPSTAPFYRLWNANVGDHFYTRSLDERNNAIANLGWAAEGIAGYLYGPDAESCGKPLYRLWNPEISDHFYTMSEVERNTAISTYGYTNEGIAGWILPA